MSTRQGAVQQLQETTAHVRKMIEIRVHLVGLTPEKASDFLTHKGVEVLAGCSYHDAHGATLLIVAEDPASASAVFEALGFVSKSDSVLLFKTNGQRAAAAQVGARLSRAGIGILHSYATEVENGQAFAIFKTTNDDQALLVLHQAERRAA